MGGGEKRGFVAGALAVFSCIRREVEDEEGFFGDMVKSFSAARGRRPHAECKMEIPRKEPLYEQSILCRG